MTLELFPQRLAAKCAAFVFFLLIATTAHAQFDTATVLGTVQDSTGAVLPRATVTLKNLATGITQSTQTDEGGAYQFFNVKIGVYQVAAEAAASSTPL